MRVTTQMLNNSARKAGLPVNNTSLLNYVNGSGGDSNSNSLLQALKSKAADKVNPADRTKYEKMEKAADRLGKQADKFTAKGENSLLEHAKATEDYTAVYKEIESLVNEYNSTMSALESAPGVINDFYLQNMRDLVSENSEALEGIGISVGKNGKLKLDKEKFEAADKETIEKVLGNDGKFTSKLSFLAGRVEDNAASNAASVSRGYSAKGDITGTYFNRYDHRG